MASMSSLTSSHFVYRRFIRDWRLILPVTMASVVAICLIVAAPVYVKALDLLGYSVVIETTPSLMLSIVTSADYVPITGDRLNSLEQDLDEVYSKRLAGAYQGHERSLRTDDFLLNPRPVIPSPKLATLGMDIKEINAGNPAYLLNMAEFKDHVRVLEGRLGSDEVSSNLLEFASKGPVAEAVIGSYVARVSGLGVGDTVTLIGGPVRDKVRASAVIVGIVEPVDRNDVFWQDSADIFFEPYGKSNETMSVIIIVTPKAASKLPEHLVEPVGHNSQQGFLVSVSGIEDKVTFVEGRMSGNTVKQGERGPVIEAVLGAPRGLGFGLKIGDIVTVTPYIDEDVWVHLEIVGVAQRTDIESDYWRWGPNGFFKLPEIPEQPLPLFVSRDVLVNIVGREYPDALLSSVWYLPLDRDEMVSWSMGETERIIRDLKIDLSQTLPGQVTFTGVSALLEELRRQRFVMSLPLFSLVATTTLVLLFFVSLMMVYVVGNRRSDISRLSAHGAGKSRILRLYGTESVVITAIAVAVSPLVAFTAVAMAGLSPYFDRFTDGGILQVDWSIYPFVVSAGAGLICLCILVIPVVISGSAGQIPQRFSSIRGTTTLLFQRYYLDILVLVVGGLVYWELQSRDQITVRGLVGDPQVNEVLLLAPVLFTLAAGLLSLRIFPVLLRFVAGESASLVHLLAVTGIVGSGVIVLLDHRSDSTLVAVVVLAAFGTVYWLTSKLRTPILLYTAFVVLVALVAGFVLVVKPLFLTGPKLVPILALIAVIPTRMAFEVISASSNNMSASVIMPLRNMARNPSPYLLLTLLIVLATGLLTFAATIGATLVGRDQDTISYQSGADIRVTEIGSHVNGWELDELYMGIPGVITTSVAFRDSGLGLPTVGSQFEVLALQSENFGEISWYRDDFSEVTLPELMQSIRPDLVELGTVPWGFDEIGLWARLATTSPFVVVDVHLQDSNGATAIVELGQLKRREWTQMRSKLPEGMEYPISVSSIRFFPVPGLIGLSGGVLIDKLFVSGDDHELVLDSFDGPSTWIPVEASMSISDSTLSYVLDALEGSGAALYSYGEGATRAVPGIYNSLNRGPLPAVLVNMQRDDEPIIPIGGNVVVDIKGRLIALEVRNIVNYFPTTDSSKRSFVVTDFDLLFGHLVALGLSIPKGSPNEIFIQIEPGAGPETLDEIDRITPSLGRIIGGSSFQDNEVSIMGLGPLATAGWQAMAGVALLVSVLIACSGYAAHIFFMTRRNRGEMVLLQFLGLTHRQVLTHLVLENLVIVIFGIALGTWAGIQMSELFLPAVSIKAPIPPVLVITDWKLNSTVWMIEVAVFLALLVAIRSWIIRSDFRYVSDLQ